MANERKSFIDGFFNLGNRVTRGSPVNKAKFDYQLYWIVFLTFICLSINYVRIYFVSGSLTSLMWGVIVLVFSWFNYWGLIAFRQTYLNMKKFYTKNDEQTTIQTDSDKGFEKAFN